MHKSGLCLFPAFEVHFPGPTRLFSVGLGESEAHSLSLMRLQRISSGFPLEGSGSEMLACSAAACHVTSDVCSQHVSESDKHG